MPKKVAWARPSYGPLEPEAVISHNLAIMHAMKHGAVEWAGDASPNRQKWDVARESVAVSACRMAKEDGLDGVFWCDSDVVLPQDAVTSLVFRDVDLVTGIYFQRDGAHWPLIAQFNPKPGFFNADKDRCMKDGKGSFQWIVSWPEGAFFQADGCGFGCIYTSTKLLLDIGDKWFRYEKFSEDFDFCIRAKRAGYNLWVDSTVLCGHLQDPKPIGIDDFHRAHPEIFGVTEVASDEARETSVLSQAD